MPSLPVVAQEQWGSRLGVVLAVSGSAVGIGNFLRFPGQAAANGGGAFLIPYFCALIFLGIPICLAEWAMGRYAGRKGFHSAPAILGVIGKGRAWRYAGVLGVVIPLAVSFYYTFIAAWCLGYFYGATRPDRQWSMHRCPSQIRPEPPLSFTTIFQEPAKTASSSDRLRSSDDRLLGGDVRLEYLPDPPRPLEGYREIRFFRDATDGRVRGGRADPGPHARNTGSVAPRPERDERPRLYVESDFTALGNPQTWLAAAGQIFFSISVGFGIIINYASYVRPKDDVALSGLTAAATNEVFEVGFGGLITLTASFVFLGLTGTIAAVSTGTFGPSASRRYRSSSRRWARSDRWSVRSGSSCCSWPR